MSRWMFGRVGSQARHIVYNLYNYYRNLKSNASTNEHKGDINIIKTIADSTGLSTPMITKVIQKGNSMAREGNVLFKSPSKKRNRKKKIDLDGFAEGVIRRKVTQFYTVKKEIPTLKKILHDLREDGVINCSLEYLRRLLDKLCFRFRKCQSKRKILIEQPNIAYLSIKQSRFLCPYIPMYV